MSLNREKYIKTISNFLNQNGASIAISQDIDGNNYRLEKPHATSEKFNWFKEDIEKHYGTLEQFIAALPSQGFSSGAVLYRRKKAGGSFRKIDQTHLTFSTSKPIPTPSQNTESMNTHPPTSQPHHSMAMGQPNQPLISTNELIDLKVIEGRYKDLQKKELDLEKRNRDLESEVRQLKEDNQALNRKFEIQEDKHQLAIDRIHQEKKNFLETEAGKEALGLGADLLGQFASKMSNTPHQAPVALGAGMSAQAQSFANDVLKNVPESEFQELGTVIYHWLQTQGFKENIIQLITQQTPS